MSHSGIDSTLCHAPLPSTQTLTPDPKMFYNGRSPYQTRMAHSARLVAEVFEIRDIPPLVEA